MKTSLYCEFESESGKHSHPVLITGSDESVATLMREFDRFWREELMVGDRVATLSASDEEDHYWATVDMLASEPTREGDLFVVETAMRSPIRRVFPGWEAALRFVMAIS